MVGFKFPESIKSRPVYGTLSVKSGVDHLMIADGEGAEAIIRLAKLNNNVIEKSHIIYIPKHTKSIFVDQLKELMPGQLYLGPSYPASVSRIRQALNNAKMGLQVYLAGTEGLIGQAQNECMSSGVPHTAIQTEHCGSVARRMQCVHCKGITEDVIMDPFICIHCGLNLFIRDHYSRRLAAFQGVCIDAEDPGNVPEAVELYK